jgi:hypothetical protein
VRRSKDQLAMSHDVEVLADRAEESGQGHRAAELRDIAAHLRAKADQGRTTTRRRSLRLWWRRRRSRRLS